MLPIAFGWLPAPVASSRRAAAAHSPAANPAVLLHAPQLAARSGQHQGSQLRGAAVVPRVAAVEFLGDVSPEDAAKFERIAASLVAKMGQVPNYDENAHEDAQDVDEEGLLPFGASPQAVAAAQAKLAERRRSPSAASGSGAAGGSMGFATGPNGAYVPRGKRTRQIPMDALPKVAIVGRPNVGKSALFNRLAGASLAVVFDQPGVTRDRLYTRAFWGDKEYVLIDTGGLMSDATRLPAEAQKAAMYDISEEGLPDAIERQAAAGVAEADSIVLLVDGQAGLQPGDREILAWLRSNHPSKPVVLAVNKCENAQKADLMASEFWELGLEPLALSALSGTGTGEVLDALLATLPPPRSVEDEDASARPLAIAIVGRPNVGKSSLLNAIVGEERSIVCDMSGTTRDAVDTPVTLPDGTKLTLIDTAGIRKRSKVADSSDGTEQLSVDRAMRAVRRADVAVLVVDGTEGVTQQDFRLSELFAGEGKAVVVVVNKWDKVDPRLWSVEKMVENVRAQLRHVSWAEVVCTSALKGKRVDDVLAAVLAAGAQHRRRISTATLNMVLKEATQWKAPPMQRGSLKKGKIYYATQAAMCPPSFVFFVNDAKLLTDDYRRYMERQLRENIGFPGTPLRLIWRGKPEREETLRTAAATAIARRDAEKKAGPPGGPAGGGSGDKRAPASSGGSAAARSGPGRPKK